MLKSSASIKFILLLTLIVTAVLQQNHITTNAVTMQKSNGKKIYEPWMPTITGETLKEYTDRRKGEPRRPTEASLFAKSAQAITDCCAEKPQGEGTSVIYEKSHCTKNATDTESPNKQTESTPMSLLNRLLSLPGAKIYPKTNLKESTSDTSESAEESELETDNESLWTVPIKKKEFDKLWEMEGECQESQTLVEGDESANTQVAKGEFMGLDHMIFGENDVAKKRNKDENDGGVSSSSSADKLRANSMGPLGAASPLSDSFLACPAPVIRALEERFTIACKMCDATEHSHPAHEDNEKQPQSEYRSRLRNEGAGILADLNTAEPQVLNQVPALISQESLRYNQAVVSQQRQTGIWIPEEAAVQQQQQQQSVTQQPQPQKRPPRTVCVPCTSDEYYQKEQGQGSTKKSPTRNRRRSNGVTRNRITGQRIRNRMPDDHPHQPNPMKMIGSQIIYGC